MRTYINNKCFVPGCKTGYKSQLNQLEKISIFKAPKDVIERKKWAKSISRPDRVLQEHDSVCEKHFYPEEVIKSIEINNVVIPYQRPQLKKGAVPSIFPDCPKYLAKKEINLTIHRSTKGIQINLNESCNIENQDDANNAIILDNEEPAAKLAEFDCLFISKTLPLDDIWAVLSCNENTLPAGKVGERTVLFSQNSVEKQTPVFHRQVVLNDKLELKYFFAELTSAINKFSKLSICFGGPSSDSFESLINVTQCAYIDNISHTWRHRNCTLVNAEENFQCRFCKNLFITFTKIYAKKNIR
ncbi:hypothetical protein ABEB36_004476 [Hypothenemus hampei]|uniref:THAP-type domain-containing protein n=1 Tax=Hypothenemus hampei TaxID=57062 RepID=A0ABD1F3T3_HYPHA